MPRVMNEGLHATLPTCAEVAAFLGFASTHPWDSLPQRLGLAALGNSVAPPMAVLCLKQLVGLWQIALDPEAYLYISPQARDPAHAVELYLSLIHISEPTRLD
eukprot:12887291-Prorocentrum_lima.AAC.1